MSSHPVASTATHHLAPAVASAWDSITRCGLLCLFKVADRADAPGGWRRNTPTTWFLSEARTRALVGELVLDVDDHPSEVCAGAALATRDDAGPAVLVIRTRSTAWELPKGGLEWDELPEEAAIRELREESGTTGEVAVVAELGRLQYFLGTGRDRRLKQVRHYAVRASGSPRLGHVPEGTLERRWLRPQELDGTPLVSESLRPLLRAALDGATHSSPQPEMNAAGTVSVSQTPFGVW